MFSIAVVSGQVYIPGMDSSAVTDQTNAKPANVVVRGNASGFLQEVVSGKHHLRGDEPASAGGGDVGPDPYDHLLASLVVCTSMTSGFYARRNKLPLENITVSLWHSRIYAKDCEECDTKEGMLERQFISARVKAARHRGADDKSSLANDRMDRGRHRRRLRSRAHRRVNGACR